MSDMDVCRLMHYTCTMNKQAVPGDKSLSKHKFLSSKTVLN